MTNVCTIGATKNAKEILADYQLSTQKALQSLDKKQRRSILVKMITLKEKTLARDARYTADYSIFPVYLIEDALGQDPLTYEVCSDRLIKKISAAIEQCQGWADKTTNQEWAYLQILQQNLWLWLDVCRKEEWSSDIDERLAELDANVIEDIRQYLKVDYAKPYPVYIKERLPSPFEESHWDALNVRPRFHPNIPIGIYLAKERLTEYSKITLYHEHLHIAITPEDAGFHFVPWFDEGVCDVVAHILSAKRFEDWSSKIEMMMRKYTVDDTEYRVRGWNAKTVAQLIINYGLVFFRYIVRARKEYPEDINWTNLYHCIKKGCAKTTLSNCFKSKIASNILNSVDKPSLNNIERTVCMKIISYELPVAISPLAYWCLGQFLAFPETRNGNFVFVPYEEFLRNSCPVDMDVLKRSCLELNGLLSISAEKSGLRSWDTVGYYKDLLDYDFIKARGMTMGSKGEFKER